MNKIINKQTTQSPCFCLNHGLPNSIAWDAQAQISTHHTTSLKRRVSKTLTDWKDGARETDLQLRALIPLAGDPVLFPAPMWQLPTFCSPSPRGSGTLFSPLRTHCVYAVYRNR